MNLQRRPTRRGTPKRRAVRHARRGVTMLEVVFAAVILAMVASSVAATFSFVVKLEARNDRRLGAHEIANRLIMQYLDAPHDFEVQLGDLPIDYGRWRYRWELRVQSGDFHVNDDEAARLAESGRAASMPNRDVRYELITVTVWGVDPEDDSGDDIADSLLANISRVTDPFAMSRNPDSLGRLGIESIDVNLPLNISRGISRDVRFGPGPGPGWTSP